MKKEACGEQDARIGRTEGWLTRRRSWGLADILTESPVGDNLAHASGKDGSLGGLDGAFALLGLVPEGFHPRARDLSKRGALLAGEALHLAESRGEFGAGFLQSEFGIEIEKAGEINGDEEEIADFRFDGLGMRVG